MSHVSSAQTKSRFYNAEWHQSLNTGSTELTTSTLKANFSQAGSNILQVCPVCQKCMCEIPGYFWRGSGELGVNCCTHKSQTRNKKGLQQRPFTFHKAGSLFPVSAPENSGSESTPATIRLEDRIKVKILKQRSAEWGHFRQQLWLRPFEGLAKADSDTSLQMTLHQTNSDFKM